MKSTNKFSPEVKERAVRMVLEQRSEYPSLWATVEQIAPMCVFLPKSATHNNRKKATYNNIKEATHNSRKKATANIESDSGCLIRMTQ